MISEYEYLYGMKPKDEDSNVIDVASNKDFPTLIGGGGAAEAKSSAGPLWGSGLAQSKPGQKSFKKKIPMKNQ
jgi:hypothetical protein